jgi:hypothetical protein
MQSRFMRWLLTSGIMSIAVLLIPIESRADTVLAGYDLLQTVTPGTSFNGVDFEGVPLGSYDFGGMIGVKAVGNTDTIVHRLSDATAAPGGNAMIPIELLALQLVSVMPTDFGLGVGFYYITLQSARGGPASTGNMTINFADPTPGGPPPEQPVGGTFTSFFDVFFDVRLGSLDGPIALSANLVISNDGTPWSHYPDPQAVTVDGVNSNLNGRNHQNDFFPIQAIVETHPSGAMHTVISTMVPEPSTLVLGGMALMLAIGRANMFRRRVS